MITKRLALFLALLLLLAPLAGCGSNAQEAEQGAGAAPEETPEDVLGFDLPGHSPAVLVHATPAPPIAAPARGNLDAPDTAFSNQQNTLAFDITPTPTLTPSPTPPPTPSPSPTPEEPTPSPSPTPAYKLTTVKNEAAHVKAKGVNLREGPGEAHDIVCVLEYLQSMVITGKTTIAEDGEEHVWYKIKYDETIGFVRKDFVALGAEPTPTPKPTATPKPSSTPKPEVTPEPEAIQKPEATPEPEIPQGGAGNYSDADIYLVAKLIYAEGKSQSTESFLAMANVLYNRCNSKSFGGTVEKEVYRSGQFTVVKYDSFESLTPSDKALSAARQVFNEGTRVLPEGVLYFRAASKGTSWSSKRKFYKTIGGNSYFY